MIDNIVLAAGKHDAPEQGMCVMELAAIATGNATFSDLPACTDPMVSMAAQRVWDRLMNEAGDDQAVGRRLVRRYLMRIIRCRPLSVEAQRRVALWCARSVEHLSGDPRVRECNDVTERDATEAELRAAWAARSAISSFSLRISSSTAAAAAASKAASAAAAAMAEAEAAARAGDLEGWFDGLLTQWEKEMADTADGLYVPREWEDAALAFIDSLVEAT